MADHPTGGSARLQAEQPGPVRRMTFEYDGDQIRLVSEQHVRMIVPPSQPPEQQAHTLGAFHVLLRDHQDKPIYRLARKSPIRHDAEVFSPPGAERSVERTPVPRPKGTFVLLVPDVPGAETLELLGRPPLAAAAFDQPQSLMRFKLKPFEGK